MSFLVEADAIAATGTFVVSVLVGIEIGLLLGVLFNLILFIRLSARLTLQIVNCKVKMLSLHNVHKKYIL